MKNTLIQFAAGLISPEDAGVQRINEDVLLTNILNFTYFIAGVVAIIVIIVAGIMYTSSSGDSSRVAIAKNALTYAIIGLVVVLSAFVLTNFVIGRF